MLSRKYPSIIGGRNQEKKIDIFLNNAKKVAWFYLSIFQSITPFFKWGDTPRKIIEKF